VNLERAAAASLGQRPLPCTGACRIAHLHRAGGHAALASAQRLGGQTPGGTAADRWKRRVRCSRSAIDRLPGHTNTLR